MMSQDSMGSVWVSPQPTARQAQTQQHWQQQQQQQQQWQQQQQQQQLGHHEGSFDVEAQQSSIPPLASQQQQQQSLPAPLLYQPVPPVTMDLTVVEGAKVRQMTVICHCYDLLSFKHYYTPTAAQQPL